MSIDANVIIVKQKDHNAHKYNTHIPYSSHGDKSPPKPFKGSFEESSWKFISIHPRVLQ